MHPSAVGRRVEVTADLQTVTVTLAGRVIAQHPRCWAKYQSIPDPAHAAAAAVLRQQPRVVPPVETDVEQRPLTDYDSAFGLTDLGELEDLGTWRDGREQDHRNLGAVAGRDR